MRLRRNQRGFRRLGAAGQSVWVRSRTERDGQPQEKLVPRVMHSFRRCRHFQWFNDKGEPVGCPLSCFSSLLHDHELPEVFASGYGCQDDCGAEGRRGGTGVGSRGALQPSSILLRVSTETPLESTGFGAQYGSHRLSLSSLDP